MYKQSNIRRTKLKINESQECNTLERKLELIMQNQDTIEAETQLIYTEKKEGVLPGYDIRTDRWELALDGLNAIDKSNAAKRDNANLQVVKNDDGNTDNQGKAEDNGSAKSEA